MVECGVGKRALRAAVKVLGYIAGVVAVLTPITRGNGFLIFLVSCLVGVGCIFLYTWLDEEPGRITLWPPNKNSQ
jgi:hypothetical protein